MSDPEAMMAEYNKFIAEGQTFEQGANYEQAVECYTNVRAQKKNKKKKKQA